MQSLYTATVVNQIFEDRVEKAALARRSTRRRRLFARRERRAPLSSPTGRIGISGAGR